MNEREKIIDIILNTDITERAADRVADDLIENDIGDVAEWKRKVEVLEGAGKLIQEYMLRVFGAKNSIINARISGLWDLALQQAEREIEENALRQALLTVEEERK